MNEFTTSKWSNITFAINEEPESRGCLYNSENTQFYVGITYIDDSHPVTLYFSVANDKNMRDTYIKKLGEYSLENVTITPILGLPSYVARVTFDPYDKEKLKTAISCIESLDPMLFNPVITLILYRHAHIKDEIDISLFIEKIKESSGEQWFEKISQAILAAEKMLLDDSKEVSWLFAQYCEEFEDWQNTIKCYHTIVNSTDKALSRKAALHVFELIKDMLDAHDTQKREKNTVIFTDEEKFYLQKTQVECMMTAKITEMQDWIDQMAHQFSGLKIGQTLKVTNVKLNTDTIFNFIACINSLNTEIAELKNKIKSLEEKALENSSLTITSSTIKDVQGHFLLGKSSAAPTAGNNTTITPEPPSTLNNTL